MGHLGPLVCPRMRLISQTKSLLPQGTRSWIQSKKRHLSVKGKVALELASAKELCDLGLALNFSEPQAHPVENGAKHALLVCGGH